MNLDLVDPSTLRVLTEQQWMAQVKELAGFRSWHFYHTYNSRKSNPGFPDLVLMRAPRVIFAELKRDKGQLTLDQIVWKEGLEGCPDVEYYLWRPSDWQQVTEVLA